MSPIRRLRALRRDARGTSAIEFAILAPMMIIAFFGLVETGQVVLAGRRTGHAASTLSDLVAQQQTVTTSSLSDSFAAGAQMLTPLPTTKLTMKVSSVTLQSNGTATVDWSQGSGMPADTKGATYAAPAGMMTSTGDSIIVATAVYTLVQASNYVIANNLGYTRVSYAKPRDGSQVTCSNC